MNAHTTIIAPIYRDHGAPDLILSERVFSALCAAMDRVAKRDMKAAERAGNVCRSARLEFHSTMSGRGEKGGKARQGRPRVTDEYDWQVVLSAIINGHTNARTIGPVIDRAPNIVHGRARKMIAAGLLSVSGPANGLRTFHITEAGRAWMEARA